MNKKFTIPIVLILAALVFAFYQNLFGQVRTKPQTRKHVTVEFNVPKLELESYLNLYVQNSEFQVVSQPDGNFTIVIIREYQ